jgi:hypothetical protein
MADSRSVAHGLSGDRLPREWPTAQARHILGLNSARLYGLHGAAVKAVGTPGSKYKQGNLSDYPSLTQPADPIETVLQCPGYPDPITPALVPNDYFTKLKAQVADAGGRRDNTRLGWMRTTV